MAAVSPQISRNYKRYLLGLLLVIFAFNWVDRVVLGLVLQNIKADLRLSDTQLGFMSGIAFAIFYSVMGIPIARWADRGNRVTIIWVTAVVWSAAVALCGVAGSFAQLLLIRIGVGVGEAGCGPAAHSLIAEHFSRAERPRAASVYSLGAPLSMVLGYFLAGWLNEIYGWRLTFILLGLPGLVLAGLAAGTLKEPRARKSSAKAAGAMIQDPAPRRGQPVVPGLREAGRILWANATFRHLLVGYSIMNFFVYGVAQWQPAFFVRSFGLQTGVLGTWLAVINGVCGLLGTYYGGRWASRHVHAEHLHLKVGAGVYVALGVLSPFIYIASSPYLAFALLAVVSTGYFFTFGPSVAAIQTLVPERTRATAFAILYLFVNLIGIGLGPLAVGTLSDVLRPWAGSDSLRYALLAMSPGYGWVAWHVWQASKTISRDMEVEHGPSIASRDSGIAVAGRPAHH